MDALEIRDAMPVDAPAVAAYHQRCFNLTFSEQLRSGELQAPDPEDTRRQLSDWFQSESRFETRVAVIDDVPVGHFTICGCRLIHLFVEPSHQGMGLGRHLLSLAEAMIAGNGHSDLVLHARTENVDAIGFYTAAGWILTDRLIQTIEHGVSYHEHVLVKSVS